MYSLFRCPVYNCLGLDIFLVGSSIISFQCATHPTVLATENTAVYIESGKPRAQSKIPE